MLLSNNRGVIMLKRFEVENFKGFKNPLVMDFTAREYEFNKNLIVNGIVNKAIVYGKNGVGKSCLGIAIFDIVWHLTDKERMQLKYLLNYLNLESNSSNAKFKYSFQFDEDEIIYEYAKRDPNFLIYEKLWINQKLVINYDYFDTNIRFVDKAITGDLNIELIDNKLSVLKYIYRNTPTNTSLSYNLSTKDVTPFVNPQYVFPSDRLLYHSIFSQNCIIFVIAGEVFVGVLR